MIFVACHPGLKPQEQLAFALKTISGFSTKEIAAALLTKEDTVAKRLSRARQTILKNNIQFDFPPPNEVQDRLVRVMEVLYLTFNEGFHSCKLLLKEEKFRSGSLYALFGLLCFHASRLESKTNAANEIVDIREQDRNKWFFPLIQMGNQAMNKSLEYEDMSIYHYEAAIAAEHIKAKTFEETNWTKILNWYSELQSIKPNTFTLLNMAIVNLQLGNFEVVLEILESLPISDLEQRAYLYYGCYAEYYEKRDDLILAISYLNTAIEKTTNGLERAYLIKKRRQLEHQSQKP